MSGIYLPGLTISDGRLLTKERRLPAAGEVLVGLGQEVEHDTVVAHINPRGYLEMVDIARALEIPSFLAGDALLCAPGDRVTAGTVIARYRSTFGLFNRECRAPISGTVERFFPATGRLTIRSLPVPLRAYVPGRVTRVRPGESVAISLTACQVQGIFGVGGEGWGRLRVVASPGAVVRPEDLGEDLAGQVLCGGAIFSREALLKARAAGAVAVVTGGAHKRDLERLTGRVIGAGVTGHEDCGLTVILTEGFGPVAMGERAFALLAAMEGRPAAVSGVTQVRAGVVRPEVVIPVDAAAGGPGPGRPQAPPVTVGMVVRIISPRRFGQTGVVCALPPDPERLETGSLVKVAVVRVESGETVTIPRCNLELVERGANVSG
jgi:hypothetical protein